MDETGYFETPENVRIRFETAGAGTRFVAWFVDQVLLWLLFIGLAVLLLLAGVSLGSLVADSDEKDVVQYFLALGFLFWGL